MITNIDIFCPYKRTQKREINVPFYNDCEYRAQGKLSIKLAIPFHECKFILQMNDYLLIRLSCSSFIYRNKKFSPYEKYCNY